MPFGAPGSPAVTQSRFLTGDTSLGALQKRAMKPQRVSSTATGAFGARKGNYIHLQLCHLGDAKFCPCCDQVYFLPHLHQSNGLSDHRVSSAQASVCWGLRAVRWGRAKATISTSSSTSLETLISSTRISQSIFVPPAFSGSWKMGCGTT